MGERNHQRPWLSALALPATWGFYTVVVFEILFMISPFGLYFYSVYATPLSILNQHESTAWLTSFVLPHFSETRATWLNDTVHRWEWIFLPGLILFVVGFVQIYGAKLITKREVTGGLYRYIRHPQYLALAIMGVATFLRWPRYLVLLGLVLMLFAYYTLARHEEERCEERFGSKYREYRSRTGMFLPAFLLPEIHGPSVRPAWMRWAIRIVLLLVALIGARALGAQLQDYSISMLSRQTMLDGLILSPARIPSDEMSRAVALAMSESEVRSRLARAGYGTGTRLLVYVVPTSWNLPDVPMEVTTGGHRGHYTPHDFPPGRFKVLFTSALTHDAHAEGDDLLRRAYGRVPILLVREDLNANKVESLADPPAHVRWGDIPTPLF
ncbi:MAG: hypothetical protein HY650_06875 [Acidobacteria bacterium]|nr:hypothetical protein [Acidobacteriota bacterium]